jgi:hypothetical protein
VQTERAGIAMTLCSSPVRDTHSSHGVKFSFYALYDIFTDLDSAIRDGLYSSDA